jgi:hypothetical protein
MHGAEHDAGAGVVVVVLLLATGVTSAGALRAERLERASTVALFSKHGRSTNSAAVARKNDVIDALLIGPAKVAFFGFKSGIFRSFRKGRATRLARLYRSNQKELNMFRASEKPARFLAISQKSPPMGGLERDSASRGCITQNARGALGACLPAVAFRPRVAKVERWAASGRMVLCSAHFRRFVAATVPARRW